jgi:NAD-dependent SIR2 family protein deacetylase
MSAPKVLFVLGAGASVDSSLGTFRGPNGTMPINNEEFYRKLISSVDTLTPGPTYKQINKIVDKISDLSFCITQNIDGLIRSCDIDYVEIHLRNTELIYDNIVMVGQNLPEDKVRIIQRNMKLNYNFILIIGTTCEYPYLRQFINKAKNNFTRVIHINPDPEYNCHLWLKTGSNNRHAYQGRPNEEHWVMNAYEGLVQFEDRYLLNAQSEDLTEHLSACVIND